MLGTVSLLPCSAVHVHYARGELRARRGTDLIATVKVDVAELDARAQPRCGSGGEAHAPAQVKVAEMRASVCERNDCAIADRRAASEREAGELRAAARERDESCIFDVDRRGREPDRAQLRAAPRERLDHAQCHVRQVRNVHISEASATANDREQRGVA